VFCVQVKRTITSYGGLVWSIHKVDDDFLNSGNWSDIEEAHA